MRIVLLSKNPKLYSTRRLVESAARLGHDMTVIDPLEVSLVLGGDGPDIIYRGEALRDVDVVLPRIGTNITEYGVAVVAQFGMMGVPVVNDASAIMRSRDKLRCLQLLARKGIDIPKTVVARNPRNISKAIELVDGTPVILKLLQGTQGVGVMIAESRQAVESVLDTLWVSARTSSSSSSSPRAKAATSAPSCSATASSARWSAARAWASSAPTSTAAATARS